MENKLDSFYKYLKDHPVLYVTKDIERALGISPSAEGYFILTNDTSSARRQQDKYAGRMKLVSGEKLLSTYELLQRPETKEFIEENKIPAVLVFKNSSLIERVCRENGWYLLNSPAELSETVENKISQLKWATDLVDYLPPHRVTIGANLPLKDFPYVVQFNRAHSGEGTFLITDEFQAIKLRNKFPKREMKISRYIPGVVFTNNNIVGEYGILQGNISLQITGLAPLTDYRFTTVGNDWNLPVKMLSPRQRLKYKEIVEAIGVKLKAVGWKGFFGIDIIACQNSDKLYLLEINARQPASAVWESALQKNIFPNGLSVFEAHLMSLLEIPIENELIIIEEGAQLIQRLTDIWRDEQPDFSLPELEKKGVKVFHTPNITDNAELVRVQSKSGLMKNGRELNELGKRIINVIMPGDFKERQLLKRALTVMDRYQCLAIGPGITCPYYNNRRIQRRIGLRALIGKGTPEEIKEEAELIILRERLDVSKFNSKGIRKFLVDWNLGIDCSGYVYHILNAESVARGLRSLKMRLSFSLGRSFIRRLIARFRPAENCGVIDFDNKKNSSEVALINAMPGDFVVITYRQNSSRNHIIVIYKIRYKDGAPRKFFYTHSIAWPNDGQYDHGVRNGEIIIKDLNKPIIEQEWREQGAVNGDNFTAERARCADSVSLRRFYWFF